MENNSFKIQFIQRYIEGLDGFEFENASNFILRLVFREYHSTRLTGDSKVDGLLYFSGSRRSFFSIYGPKKSNWKKQDKYKVNKDAEGIQEFLERHELELNRWYFIINRELSGDEIEYIKMKFNDPKKVEIITPSKFIELIVKKDVIVEVARFFNLVHYDVPLMDLQPHAFLKKALSLLSSIKTDSKERKLETLDAILEAIVDLTHFDKGSNFISYTLNKRVANVKIHETKLKSFAYIDGEFIELNEVLETRLHKNDQNHFVFTPTNLYYVYSITKKLRKQLIMEDIYNIEVILNQIFSNISIRKQLKDAVSG